VVRQASVVESKAVQDSGLQVIEVHWILGNGQPEVVRAADREPGPDAAACQPGREAVCVVIATGVCGILGPPELAHRRSAKLVSPDDQSAVCSENNYPHAAGFLVLPCSGVQA